jgi:hypothetical protein
VDYYDDGVVHLECTRGHKTIQLIQSAKFEILMESGAAALLNGFTLEACASFSAALERFYEFALRVMCTARNSGKSPGVACDFSSRDAVLSESMRGCRCRPTWSNCRLMT